MRLSVELYIGDERLDLFDDENISINLSVKNLTQLDKVFTDFTQSFTIPASKQNNKVLEHWYNAEVTTSFNPALKLGARIELNQMPFRYGVVSIDKATIKDGRIDNYTITFFGNNRNLKQLFGEDDLTDLDLSSYSLAYNSYKTAMQGTVSSGNVCIPLISPERAWEYNTDTDTNSIKYSTGNSTGIIYNETKPAIKLKAILDAIETKYSITFNSTFFDSTDFGNLYMWAHREAGKSINYSSPYTRMVETSVTDPSGDYDSGNHEFIITNTTGSATNTFSVDVTIANGDDVVWDLLAYDTTGNQVLYEQKGFVGSRLIDVLLDRPTSGTQTVFFAVRSSTPTTFTFEIITSYGVVISKATTTDFSIGSFHFTNDSYTDTLTSESLTAVGGLPKQKIGEFLGGLIQMFNLIIEPVSATEFNIEPLDDWRSNGGTTDLSKYIDTSESSVRPSDLYGEIYFKYSDSKTILADRFKKDNNNFVGYGDLRSFITDSNGEPISSSTFTLELPFTNIIWERLADQTSDNAETDIVVGKFIDENLKPVVEKPYIFYRVGTESLSSSEYIAVRRRASETATSLQSYNFCFQWNTKTDSYTHSLNFGSEINPYTYNDGTASTPSLYIDYYDSYITELYDLAFRRYTFKGILPVGVLVGFSMNDVITIGANRYRINSMNVSLTTGESTLDLINITS
jgi:hypothetical protein